MPSKRKSRHISIVADENILGLERFFSSENQLSFTIKKLAGRSISQEDLLDCEVLLVRSVTQVNAKLLSNTKVRFVGTATAGLEHIDEVYLTTQGIEFCHAKGANANAVAEYVVSCLAYLSLKSGENYFSKKIGIIGHGYVGKALEKKLKALNSHIIIYDPYLSDHLLISEGEEGEVSYDSWEAIQACEVISCHVPFSDTGKYPTKNLLSKEFFNKFSSQGIIINAARGGICDEDCLLEKLSHSHIKTVWDVWSDEPYISKTLCEKVDIGTPHIAGYSMDAKLNATWVLFEKLSQFLNLPSNSTPDIDVTSHANGGNNVGKKTPPYFDQYSSINSLDDVFRLIISIYNPMEDYEALKKAYHPENNPERNIGSNGKTNQKAFLQKLKPSIQYAEHFDALRKSYSHRLEWSNYSTEDFTVSDEYKKILAGLGFNSCC